MNVISIIVSILIPLAVVAYIFVDLKSSKYATFVPRMSYDKKIDELNHASGENCGERLSQSEILANTEYMLDNYADILTK
jgi:hypothetical protein